MNKGSTANLITSHLWDDYTRQIDSAKIKNPLIRNACDEMMGNLIKQIHHNIESIRHRIFSDKQKRLKLNQSGAFGSVSYIIRADGGSILLLKLNIKTQTNYDTKFLINKLQKKFFHSIFRSIYSRLRSLTSKSALFSLTS